MRIDPEKMLELYRHGAFPMGDRDGKLYLVSPDPRTILPLEAFRVSHGLAEKLRSRRFPITFDEAFTEVVDACADRPVTWITPELRAAYLELRRLGRAHSVEAWSQGRLAGGVYGLCAGGAFFAESMFHRLTDGGMAAVAALVSRLRKKGFELLDVQFMTPHLSRCGAVEVTRAEYLKRLGAAIKKRSAW
jgi:leucyl/phenylalanyl-tRNA--protein transferase